MHSGKKETSSYTERSSLRSQTGKILICTKSIWTFESINMLTNTFYFRLIHVEEKQDLPGFTMEIMKERKSEAAKRRKEILGSRDQNVTSLGLFLSA